MSNQTFAEYSTSTAFSVQLSKNQCNALLRVAENSFALVTTVGTLKTLEARGLVYWATDETGRPNGFKGLTKAGELMVELLREAGLTVESTNSVSVLRKIAA